MSPAVTGSDCRTWVSTWLQDVLIPQVFDFGGKPDSDGHRLILEAAFRDWGIFGSA